MIRRLFLPLIATVIICSCTKPKNLVYTNDAEQGLGWINQHTLKRVPDAHSGGWVSVTDTASVYSLTLREKLSEVRKVNASNVVVRAWIKFKSMAAKGGMVVAVEENGKALQWELLPLESIVKKAGEWTEVRYNVALKSDLPDGAVVSVYMWNTSREEMLLDDMEVRFPGK